jgi:hypothetical protein
MSARRHQANYDSEANGLLAFFLKALMGTNLGIDLQELRK